MIRFDFRELQQLARQLGQAGARGREELQRARLDMLRRAKAEAGRIIRREYNVKVGPLNDRIKVSPDPNQFGVIIGVTAEDARRRISVKDFNETRLVATGVRVQLRKATPATVIPRSFEGRGKIRGIFIRRSGEKRFPVRSIGGLSARAMLERESVVNELEKSLLEKASDDVTQRIARLIE